MKICKDCNAKLIKRGNNVVRCKKCQRIANLEKWKRCRKLQGNMRTNKETYQWWKQIEKLRSNELQGLVTIYRIKLKHTSDYMERLKLKMRLKRITKIYSEKSVSPRFEKWKTLMLSKSNKRETGDINWEKAEHGWTDFYDDGVVTLLPSLFFFDKTKIRQPKTLKYIYMCWRHGYI